MRKTWEVDDSKINGKVQEERRMCETLYRRMLSFLLRVSELRCSSMEHMLKTCCITASCRRSS